MHSTSDPLNQHWPLIKNKTFLMLRLANPHRSHQRHRRSLLSRTFRLERTTVATALAAAPAVLIDLLLIMDHHRRTTATFNTCRCWAKHRKCFVLFVSSNNRRIYVCRRVRTFAMISLQSHIYFGLFADVTHFGFVLFLLFCQITK